MGFNPIGRSCKAFIVYLCIQYIKSAAGCLQHATDHMNKTIAVSEGHKHVTAIDTVRDS